MSRTPSISPRPKLTVAHGMAVQAKAGFAREMLMSVARQALCAWPSRPE
jgi:hypothetical protein